MKTLILLSVILTSCATTHTISTDYSGSISNPVNIEYVEEVAFNLNIAVEAVTQEQFNKRYKPLKP